MSLLFVSVLYLIDYWTMALYFNSSLESIMSVLFVSVLYMLDYWTIALYYELFIGIYYVCTFSVLYLFEYLTMSEY